MKLSPQKQTLLLSIGIVVVFSAGLIASFFFKEKWLWMDEVLSYLLISDPSPAHLNAALMSGMDANPPLFPNVYWVIGHLFSLEPLFLRGVSVVLFAGALALFYAYVTRLVGTPALNFVLVTAVVSLTYLNLSLATQIRTYALFLLLACGYFIALHRLLLHPTRVKWLLLHGLLGTLLALTHNFALFYLTAAGALVGLFWRWSGDRRYLGALASFGGVALLWLLLWYPGFAVQAEAGKPHSWIPLPTLQSFFYTVGDLAPTFSSRLEHRAGLFRLLPVLRFGLVVGVFGYIAATKLRAGYQSLRQDPAALFYLLAGFLYLVPMGIAVVISFAHTSVFLNRYLWPGHLLLVYQVVYAGYYFLGNRRVFVPLPLLPVYGLLLAVFLFYQNRKVAIFPSGILSYLPPLSKNYPVFVETADYFLPVWMQHPAIPVRYVLNWETAARPDNILNATVEHKILQAVKENYGVPAIVSRAEFNRANFPRFYVVDEERVYQVEDFVRRKKITVVDTIQVDIPGHRILECRF